MKCPNCNDKGEWWYLVSGEWVGEPCPQCHHGWLPFWTPAERAGLKAIGEVLRIAYSHDQEAVVAVEYSIRNYVKAARAAKEKA